MNAVVRSILAEVAPLWMRSRTARQQAGAGPRATERRQIDAPTSISTAAEPALDRIVAEHRLHSDMFRKPHRPDTDYWRASNM